GSQSRCTNLRSADTNSSTNPSASAGSSGGAMRWIIACRPTSPTAYSSVCVAASAGPSSAGAAAAGPPVASATRVLAYSIPAFVRNQSDGLTVVSSDRTEFRLPFSFERSRVALCFRIRPALLKCLLKVAASCPDDCSLVSVFWPATYSSQSAFCAVVQLCCGAPQIEVSCRQFSGSSAAPPFAALSWFALPGAPLPAF